MNAKCLTYFFAAWIVCSPLSAWGERLGLTVQKEIVLTKVDSSELTGHIIQISEEKVTFRTPDRVVWIPIEEIRSVRLVATRESERSTDWHANPNRSRLLFGPTGRTLKAGEGYFADHMVFLPAIAIGLNDRFTLGAGMSLIPGIGMQEQLFFLMPKLGIYSSTELDLAVGALIGGFPGSDDVDGAGGILYGVGTFGSDDASITAGIGFGFMNRDVGGRPILMLGGEKRLSKGVALVTENWILPGAEGNLISYGCRLFGERLSVDLALINTIGEDTMFPGIPYIDVVYAFGR